MCVVCFCVWWLGFCVWCCVVCVCDVGVFVCWVCMCFVCRVCLSVCVGGVCVFLGVGWVLWCVCVFGFLVSGGVCV